MVLIPDAKNMPSQNHVKETMILGQNHWGIEHDTWRQPLEKQGGAPKM